MALTGLHWLIGDIYIGIIRNSSIWSTVVCSVVAESADNVVKHADSTKLNLCCCPVQHTSTYFGGNMPYQHSLFSWRWYAIRTVALPRFHMAKTPDAFLRHKLHETMLFSAGALSWNLLDTRVPFFFPSPFHSILAWCMAFWFQCFDW